MPTRRPAAIYTKWRFRLAVAGIGAFGLPSVLLLAARSIYAAQDATAMLVGVPLVIAFTLDLLESDQGNLGSILLPALAGLAGVMLLTPVGLPISLQGWSGFLLDLSSALCVGVFSVLAYRLTRECGPLEGFRSMAVGNAMFYAVTAVILFFSVQPRSEQDFSAWPDLCMLGVVTSIVQALGFTLIRQLPPVAFSARFAIVPLVAVAEGFIMWKPGINLRTLAGASLMIFSTFTLVSHRRQESISPDRLLFP